MHSNSHVVVNCKQATGAVPLLILGLFFTFVGHRAASAADGDGPASPPFVYVGKLDGAVAPGRPFSPDGKLLVVRTKEGAKVVDAGTLKPVAGLMPHAPVKYASFINGGKELFTAGGKTVCYWDVPTAKLLSSVEVADEEIFAAAVREDGKRFALKKSPDVTTAWLWWRDKNKPVGSMGHTHGIESIDFVREGKCIFTSEQTRSEREEHVHLWDADTAEELAPCAVFGPNKEFMRAWELTDAWLDPGGTRVLVAEKGAFSVFELLSGRRLSHGEIVPPDPWHNNEVRQLQWSPTGDKVIIVAGKGTGPGDVEVFDAKTGKLLRTLAPRTEFMTLSADGARIICMNLRNPPTLWDVTTGECLQTFDGGHCAGAAISPSGDRVVLIRDQLSMWKANGGKESPPTAGPSSLPPR
ncbi:MAG TPA: hypothetical protein VG269_11280 [Tepidisphaeraceae bacterium]|nr:hypothetical protein [Tepidisphaeraceae bacterium]